VRRSLLLLPVVTLALIVLATASVAARSPVALGISAEVGHSHDPGTVIGAIQGYTSLGLKPAMWTIWSDWGARGPDTTCSQGESCAFPSAVARSLKARKVTPFIWWQPTNPADPDAGVYERHKNIISGKHDAYIKTWAKAAKAHGGPVIVRMFHEMNGRWFPWGIEKRFDNSATTFNQAWRHVVSLFRQVGARNVKFLWSPYNTDNGAYRPFYPGNEWVDFVGVTSLNWGENGGRSWRELSGILKRPMAAIRNVSRTSGSPQGKPVILPEVGSNYVGGDKAAWITRGYKHAYNKYPSIRGMVYLDYNTAAVTAGQPDWRLGIPDGSGLAAYQSVASQKLFKASIP
jgi:beta-mannanase